MRAAPEASHFVNGIASGVAASPPISAERSFVFWFLVNLPASSYCADAPIDAPSKTGAVAPPVAAPKPS